MSMYLNEAILRWLRDSDLPLITEFELFVQVWRLLSAGEYGGESIRKPPYSFDVHRNRALIRRLQKQQIIAPDTDFRAGVWHVIQAPSAAAADEACCLVDPFCYVSHLSAMQRYGFTDRAPLALHLTTLRGITWSQARDELVSDLTESIPVDRVSQPKLNRVGIRSTVRRRPVIVHETIHPSLTRIIRTERTRLSEVGSVFVEMLAQPALCGGMAHVLDVWENHAADSLHEIIDAVDNYPKKLVKVRAGYILSEILDIENGRVNAWRKFAQRGGSQKLDPDAPYAETYSESWMLSINV